MEIYTSRLNRYESELKKIEKANISRRNKDLILEFGNYLFSTTSKQLRVAKVSGQLRKIAEILQVDFNKATKQDLQRVISEYNRKTDIAEATKGDYRRTIKQFYRWFQDEDDRLLSSDTKEIFEVRKLYTYLNKDVRAAYKKNYIDSSTILTEEKINKVIVYLIIHK